MTEIIARVKGINKATSKTNRPFYKIQLDNGTTLFAWKFDLIKSIKTGEQARFLVENNNNFLYVRAAELVADAPDSVDPWDEAAGPDESEVSEDAYTKPRPEPTYDKEKGIARMSALKTAIEYLTYCGNVSEDIKKGIKPCTEEEAIGIAERFYKFIIEGE